jgi:hypothetical protein
MEEVEEVVFPNCQVNLLVKVGSASYLSGLLLLVRRHVGSQGCANPGWQPRLCSDELQLIAVVEIIKCKLHCT